MVDLVIRDVPKEHVQRALNCILDFADAFPMKSGRRDGCGYSYGPLKFYVYRTAGGSLVCRPGGLKDEQQ